MMKESQQLEYQDNAAQCIDLVERLTVISVRQNCQQSAEYQVTSNEATLNAKSLQEKYPVTEMIKDTCVKQSRSLGSGLNASTGSAHRYIRAVL